MKMPVILIRIININVEFVKRKFLSRNGEAAGFAIILVMLAAGFLAVLSLYKDIDAELIMLQKSRHQAAIERALSDALTSINSHDPMSLDTLGLGHQIKKKVYINLDKFTETFYRSIYRNMKIYDDPARQAAIKKYIPMKAVILYDTMYISGPDDTWLEYKLCYDYKGTMIYFSLTDEVYTLDGAGNKVYSTFDSFGITPEIKRGIFAWRVRTLTNDFINNHKSSADNYYVNITNFDDKKFEAAISDVTLMCLVEGIPIKTLLSDSPDRSFYCFAFGGASVVRNDGQVK